DRQRLVDGGNRKPERTSRDPIDVDVELRRVRLPLGADLREHGASTRGAEQLVARRDERLVAVPGAVLQHEREAARLAELGDRRRIQREYERLLDRGERAAGTLDDRS